jgi:hypothetical protein
MLRALPVALLLAASPAQAVPIVLDLDDEVPTVIDFDDEVPGVYERGFVPMECGCVQLGSSGSPVTVRDGVLVVGEEQEGIVLLISFFLFGVTSLSLDFGGDPLDPNIGPVNHPGFPGGSFS